jgi:hypothetical protein
MDSLAIHWSDNRDCSTGASRATGATDAVHIVICVMRHVEVEHVTDLGDVEAARGDVRARSIVRLRRDGIVECRRTRGLIQIAVQCDGIELVTEQERWRLATSRLRLQNMIAFLKPEAERISPRSVSRLLHAVPTVETNNCV